LALGFHEKKFPGFQPWILTHALDARYASLPYSQQEAISHLREINAEISNLLGIDFASLAKKTNC